MGQIGLILGCLMIGVVLRLSGKLPDNTSKVLGGWVINVALPAAAINSVHNVSLRGDWWMAAATPWIAVALSLVVIVPICRLLRWSRQRTGALVLLSGWGNTAFVGLPMITAFAGAQWVGLGIVIDLFGSFLALSTIGIAVATVCSSGRLDWRVIGRRIVTFPPTIALAIALATNHLAHPAWLTNILTSLQQTLTPLALAAIGFALRLDRIAGRVGALSLALGFRLLLAPLFFVGMYLALGCCDDPVAKVAMLEMAMPPMLGASIIAIDHDLEPDLVSLVIGIGIPVAMLSAWGWWSVICHL